MIPSEDEALPTLLTVLRTPSAQWHNKGQKLAVMAGLQWASDVVVIHPTSTGKSAVVATVALLERNSVTAVLCPLHSPLMNWEHCLHGAQVHRYHPGLEMSSMCTSQWWSLASWLEKA